MVLGRPIVLVALLSALLVTYGGDTDILVGMFGGIQGAKEHMIFPLLVTAVIG